MKLTFKFFDGRGRHQVPVIDLDTGKEVGHVVSYGVGFYNTGGIRVSLLDGKYSGEFDSRKACWGFVKGVEAVLNHMTSFRDQAVAARDADEAA
jgi:hypothetical protein